MPSKKRYWFISPTIVANDCCKRKDPFLFSLHDPKPRRHFTTDFYNLINKVQ